MVTTELEALRDERLQKLTPPEADLAVEVEVELRFLLLYLIILSLDLKLMVSQKIIILNHY